MFASKNCGSNVGLSSLKGHCLLQKMISSAILSVVARTANKRLGSTVAASMGHS
jgi:hypothetical protein